MRVFWILCVYFCVLVNGQFDLSNLGSLIDQNVRRHLASLDDLNAQIHQQINPLNDLGPRIQQDVQSRLAGLENLGEEIQKQVETNLEPVRALAVRLEMINGVGGKTVISFPNGKTLIAKNGDLFDCSGAINDRGDCQGPLSPIDFSKNETYCYVSPNVVANNYFCFSGKSQGISISVVNGHVRCTTEDNKPYLLISVEDYEKMCNSVGGRPTYTYYADPNDPRGIQDSNPLKKCMGKATNACVFQ